VSLQKGRLLQSVRLERDEALIQLKQDKDVHAKRVMDLRKEVMAVQSCLTEDKERACGPVDLIFTCSLNACEDKTVEHWPVQAVIPVALYRGTAKVAQALCMSLLHDIRCVVL
jgi:hypothetical protein